MISAESFKKNWILSVKSKSKGSDPSIIEKMIWAFYLTEFLTISGLKYVFKGGTSLALLSTTPKRFSVDVDIQCDVTRVDLENHFNYVKVNSEFIYWELDDKRSYKKGIPKAHYKFFFKSAITEKEQNIVLDILFENYIYIEIIEKEIKSEIFITNGPFTIVNIPSINCLTGDKLTAFAPNTIGIEYGKDKETEIVKQLFDLNYLIDSFTDIKVVQDTYELICNKQIIYRNLKITKKETLNDTINTTMMLSFGRLKYFKEEVDRNKYYEIEKGITKFRQFPNNMSFNPDHVLIASCKAAYLALIINSGLSKTFIRYNEKMNINEYLITKKEYSKLNKLKALPNGVLYYLKNLIEY